MSELLGKMAESLIAGNIDKVVNLTKEALASGASPSDNIGSGSVSRHGCRRAAL